MSTSLEELFGQQSSKLIEQRQNEQGEIAILNQFQNQKTQTSIKVSAEILAIFLKYVSEGEQDEAEALLKDKPELAVYSSDVTDLSGRSFKGITAFQYAVWALDFHMWTMIRKYLPNQAAHEQILQVDKSAWAKQYGASISWQNLIDALQKYIDLCDDSKWSEAATQWKIQVGGAQKLLPVHVVNEYCRPDRPFHPCPDFIKDTTLPRTRKTYEGEWYTATYNNGKLGETFFTFIIHY
jgi:hypothetical protein